MTSKVTCMSQINRTRKSGITRARRITPSHRGAVNREATALRKCTCASIQYRYNTVLIRLYACTFLEDAKLRLEMENGTIFTGLVRLAVPRSVREYVKNDVILRMAIQDVTETLYLYVDSEDKHASASYTSELYNLTWDIACTLDKEDVDIRVITPAVSFASWGEFFLLPDLGAVYGEYQQTPEHVKWLQRTDLLPVSYRSPAAAVWRYMIQGQKYFGEGDASVGKFEVIIMNGTFDHLHLGHKRLLTLAANICKSRLIIGVTASPELLAAKPFADFIEPFKIRADSVRDFVSSINSSIIVEIQAVDEEGGPIATCAESGACVVVSTSDIETFSSTNAARSLVSLPILSVRIARRTDRSTLSSSRIRESLAAASGVTP